MLLDRQAGEKGQPCVLRRPEEGLICEGFKPEQQLERIDWGRKSGKKNQTYEGLAFIDWCGAMVLDFLRKLPVQVFFN